MSEMDADSRVSPVSALNANPRTARCCGKICQKRTFKRGVCEIMRSSALRIAVTSKCKAPRPNSLSAATCVAVHIDTSSIKGVPTRNPLSGRVRKPGDKSPGPPIFCLIAGCHCHFAEDREWNDIASKQA